MTGRWFYTRAGQSMEPVTADHLRQLARDGLLNPTDMLWCEGMPQWVPAGSVPEFFPAPGFRRGDSAAPRPPSAVAGREDNVPVIDPVVLEPTTDARAALAWSPLAPPLEEATPQRRRRAEDHLADWARVRRRGRNRHTWLIVLMGLGFGGSVLLVALVLGLFFIVMSGW